MSQKAARSGGEARGVCSLGAPLPQWVLAGVLYRHGPRSRYGSNCRFRSRRRVAAVASLGPLQILRFRVESPFCSISSSAVRPLAMAPQFLHGGRRGPCSISIRSSKAARVVEEMLQNISSSRDLADAMRKKDWIDEQVCATQAAAVRTIGPVAEAGRAASEACTRARILMSHPDVDLS